MLVYRHEHGGTFTAALIDVQENDYLSGSRSVHLLGRTMMSTTLPFTHTHRFFCFGRTSLGRRNPHHDSVIRTRYRRRQVLAVCASSKTRGKQIPRHADAVKYARLLSSTSSTSSLLGSDAYIVTYTPVTGALNPFGISLVPDSKNIEHPWRSHGSLTGLD